MPKKSIWLKSQLVQPISGRHFCVRSCQTPEGKQHRSGGCPGWNQIALALEVAVASADV